MSQYPPPPGQQPYPQQPYPQQPYGAPAVKPPKPSSVSLAVNLIWANVVLSLIGTVVSFVMLDDIIDNAIGNDRTLDQDSVRAGIIAVVVVIAAISIGLYILLAVFIGKGANWARITWTVFAGLSILSSLANLGRNPGSLIAIGLLGLALTIVTLVLLYQKPSNDYFRK